MADWPNIVNDYSSRNLIYGKDKLPALAGLAKKGHGETGHLYVAGMWLEKLEYELLWTARMVPWVYQKPMKPKPLRDYVPSWSWASVDGKVEVPRSRRNLIISITKHAFVFGVGGLAFGKKTFGQVHRATLSMECEVLIPARPKPESPWKPSLAMFHYTGVNETEPFIFRTTLDFDDVANGVKYLLPLHTRIEYGNGSWPAGAYAISNPKGSQIVVGGLVLGRTGQSKGQYRRIGIFHPHFNSEDGVQKLAKLMKTFIPDLKEMDYETRFIDETTGHERCTITII